MTLVQISPSSPCANLGYVVGIDFGTTNSLVAYAKTPETIKIIPIENGDLLLPSVVLYEESAITVGKEAAKNDNAIFSIKRLIGGDASKFAEKFPAFQLLEQDENIALNINGKKISNIEISSEIIKKLKFFAEKHLKESVSTAVITVPAYFNNKAKEMIKLSAKLVGINAIRLLAEPTAAALAYKIKKNGTYVVYDLGGGTFDVSVIGFKDGIFKVIAVGGDDTLGGDDFDYLLMQNIIDTLSIKVQSANELKQLKKIAKKLKEKLNNTDKTSTQFLYNNAVYDFSITEKKFAEIVDDLIEKTITITEETIKLANKTISSIENILLVGGSTRANHLKNKLKNKFGKDKILSSANPETVVVEGAALQAYSLNFGSKTLLIDVIPLSLGIETMGGVMEKIIERNTSIPIAKSQTFTTHIDGQTSILINIFQGERELVKENKKLATLELKGIPPMSAGVAKIKVIFALDENALLNIKAHETVSDTVQETLLNPNYELTKEEIDKMIADSFTNAKEDLINRELASDKVDLEKTIFLLSSFISEDKDLLIKNEEKEISQALEEARNTLKMYNPKLSKIKLCKQAIEKTSEKFLERRFEKYLKMIKL